MSITRVTRNYQVTIPAEIRRKLHIHVGTIVDFIYKGGALILKPKALIDEDQAWFWTKAWQEEEKEVDQAIKKGQTISFKDVDQMRKHFEK